MNASERAGRLALMVLRELAGVSNDAKGEQQFQALMRLTRDAAAEAGMDVVMLYKSVAQELYDADDPAYYGLLRLSDSVRALH